MTPPDEIPSLADLRRRPRGRRAAATTTATARTPSLFDAAVSEPAVAPAALKRRGAAAKTADGEARVWRVSELVRGVRAMVEQGFAQIVVEGEISNWRPAASGHCYFTLKDDAAQLSIVMFQRQASLLRFRPKDGDAVRLRGSLSVYESRGQMQLVAETMEPLGLGALLAAVQQLKERLRREGVFENQRALPPFPRCVGVVTSLQGAALRDILKVCRRRHAALQLLIYPAAVQGANCAAEVAAGVRWFSAHKELVDVVLVARGGGSWEDLHGFNDETLARTIAACAVPVIVGVGHATDTTIADAAADVCAPTPSAAAEMVTASQHKVEERVEALQRRLARAGRFEVLRCRQRLSGLGAEMVLRQVREALQRREQRVDDLQASAEMAIQAGVYARQERLRRAEARLRERHPRLRVAEDQRQLQSLQMRLRVLPLRQLRESRAAVEQATARLRALNPLRVLERGYALVYREDGTLLRAAEDAATGTAIVARLAKGRVRAKVTGSE